MADRFRKLVKILSLLPANGSQLKTKEIHEELAVNPDYACSIRTVERDLMYLYHTFPGGIAMEQVGQHENAPKSWSVTSGRALLPQTLLTDRNIVSALVLLKQQAFYRLPRSLFDVLSELWARANAVARQQPDAQQWMQLVQHLPDPLRPAPPSIAPAVQKQVESALLQSAPVELTLMTLDGGERVERVQPVRLLLQEEVLYLLASTEDNAVRLWPMHHIIKVRDVATFLGDALEPDLVQSQALGIGDNRQLTLRVHRPLAEALFERPIGRGQAISRCKKDTNWFIATTEIDDSPQLRRWLARRMPDELTIVEPQALAVAVAHERELVATASQA